MFSDNNKERAFFLNISVSEEEGRIVAYHYTGPFKGNPVVCFDDIEFGEWIDQQLTPEEYERLEQEHNNWIFGCQPVDNQVESCNTVLTETT